MVECWIVFLHFCFLSINPEPERAWLFNAEQVEGEVLCSLMGTLLCRDIN